MTDPTLLPRAGAARTAIGGALMGIANIIPGVSGGTMILATGLYEDFVAAVSNITRLRFRWSSVRFLAVLTAAALIAIGASVFPIRWGLENCHHLMFAGFIGLTLGGVPLLWRDLKPIQPPAIVGAVLGIALMAIIAFGLKRTELPVNWVTYLVAGFIATAAMILPGISGSYLLLIFGLYTPFTGAIKDFIGALKDADWPLVFSIGGGVIVPIGLGVVLGIAGLTNALRWLLKQHHQPTVGLLLGLLLGSVLGLFPFSALVEKGEVLAAAPPITAINVALVVLFAILGFAMTVGVSRLGGESAMSESTSPQ
jgi:putative membrane protein